MALAKQAPKGKRNRSCIREMQKRILKNLRDIKRRHPSRKDTMKIAWSWAHEQVNAHSKAHSPVEITTNIIHPNIPCSALSYTSKQQQERV